MDGTQMATFWDERARENAAYFVDNTLDYRRTDLDGFWARGPVIVDQVLEEVGAPAIRASDDVLEIGCGIGRLTRPLSSRARRVVALDVSAEMVRRAREANAHLENVEWLVGDGVSLSGVADASVDVIFSHVVFQHVPDPAITLGYVREMGRVLRPGGWAAFQVSNDQAIHRPRAALRTRVTALLRRAPRGQDHEAWLGSSVDLDALREAAVAGGTEVEAIAGEGTQFCFVLLRRQPRAGGANST